MEELDTIDTSIFWRALSLQESTLSKKDTAAFFGGRFVSQQEGALNKMDTSNFWRCLSTG